MTTYQATHIVTGQFPNDNAERTVAALLHEQAAAAGESIVPDSVTVRHHEQGYRSDAFPTTVVYFATGEGMPTPPPVNNPRVPVITGNDIRPEDLGNDVRMRLNLREGRTVLPLLSEEEERALCARRPKPKIGPPTGWAR